MNKKRRNQNPRKAVRITNPTPTIRKSDPNPKSRAKPNSHNLENDELLPATSVSLTIFEKSPILSPDFYQIDALDLAPRLLGKYLKKDDVVLQITEVEAYRQNDSACHGRFGITARTAPVMKGWKRLMSRDWPTRVVDFRAQEGNYESMNSPILMQ